LLPIVLIELCRSGIAGIGVFAIKSIRKGQKIADGLSAEDFKTLIPWEKFHRFDSAVRKKIWDFCIGTPEGFVPPEDFDFNKLSVEWYFNHSCDGNVGFNSDGDFRAIRKISKDEELTYDYGLAESNPRFKMRCKCGSKDCRRIITGNDWKNEEFSKRSAKYMHPRLQELTSGHRHARRWGESGAPKNAINGAGHVDTLGILQTRKVASRT
jgi:hypothetical protein